MPYKKAQLVLICSIIILLFLVSCLFITLQTVYYKRCIEARSSNIVAVEKQYVLHIVSV